MTAAGVPLNELAELITKGTTPKTLGRSYTSAGIPFLRAENIRDLSVDWEDDPLFIDDATDSLLARSRILPNDVLISIAGTIGRVGVVSSSAPRLNCNQAVAIVRPSFRLVSRYLAYWLASSEAQRQMAAAQVTATISNLSLGQIAKLLVPLPPFEEQQRIVALLDKCDAIRRKRKEANTLTGELLRSAFLEMFGDPVANPRAWPSETINELCARGANLVDGPFGSSLKPDQYVRSGAKVVRNWNIYDDHFDSSEFKYVTLAKFEELRRSEVLPGDVLVTTKGTVGDVCIAPELGGPALLSASGTVRLRVPADSTYLAEFVVAQMTTPSYKRYVHTFEAGSAQQYLNLSSIKKMRLIRPPIEQQRRFSGIRGRIRMVCEHASAACNESQRLFASLSDRVFATRRV